MYSSVVQYLHLQVYICTIYQCNNSGRVQQSCFQNSITVLCIAVYTAVVYVKGNIFIHSVWQYRQFSRAASKFLLLRLSDDTISLPPPPQTPESLSDGGSEYSECRRCHREGPHPAQVHRPRLHSTERHIRQPVLVYLDHAGTHLPTGQHRQHNSLRDSTHSLCTYMYTYI